MSFMITIARALKRGKKESQRKLLEDGFFYIKELDVWIGEYGGDPYGRWEQIGEFIWDPEFVHENLGGDSSFDGALNEDIPEDARAILLYMNRLGMPKEVRK